MDTVMSQAEFVIAGSEKIGDFQKTKKVYNFNTAKEIPELNGEIDCYNSHVFYSKLAKFAKKVPPGTKLFLNLSGIVGDSSCVASMIEIECKLIRKGGRLKVSGIGEIIKEIIILLGVERIF